MQQQSLPPWVAYALVRTSLLSICTRMRWCEAWWLLLPLPFWAMPLSIHSEGTNGLLEAQVSVVLD